MILPPANPRRVGQTLLELIAASTLTAVALVPALKLMGESMTLSREVETRNLLTTLCVSKLEEQLARTAVNWTTGTEAGDFAAQGIAGVRYETTRSENVAQGGIPDQLMALQVTVWRDANNDAALGASELQVTMRSKIAKLLQYQHEAGGM